MKLKSKIEQFLLSDYSIPAMILLGLAIGLFCQLRCSAQVFTNNSPAVNMGQYATSSDYTIQFKMKTDTGFHKNRTVTLFEIGNQKAYISYPYLVYNGSYTVLSGKSGYQKIADKNVHTLTFRVGEGVREVLVDSFIISSTPSPAATFNGSLWLSSNSSIDKLSATITDFTFSPSFLKLKKEIPQPVQVLDSRNLPQGLIKDVDGNWDYTNVKSCCVQLADALNVIKPIPPTVEKTRLMFDFLKAGGEDHGIPTDSAIKAGVAIAVLMADKGNCDFRMIGNTTDFISYKDQPNSPHGKFNTAMINAANAHPDYEIRVDCSLSHLPSLPGHPAITTAQINAMLPNVPLETFDDMAYILEYHYTEAQARSLKPIKTALVDNEYFNNWLDTVRYNTNVSCKAAKEASGLSWWDYCSQRYAACMNRMYDGIRRACPGIEIIEYDVNALDGCNNYYFPKFKYRVGLNTDGRGSTQLYPREMINLLSGGLTSGDKRGLLRYFMLSKREEIKQGHPLNAPFFGVGYLGNPDFDINPTHTVGLETFVTATGSPYTYPALFVDGGNNPNPKSYAYQMYSAVLAQSACQKVWDIITTGQLLAGDRNASWQCFGGTNYTFWFGDYEVAAAVMKLGSRYAITTFSTSMTNLKTGVGLKKSGGIYLNGQYIPLEAGAQSFVYEYNETLPIVAGSNPKRVNGWVQVGLIENWD